MQYEKSSFNHEEKCFAEASVLEEVLLSAYHFEQLSLYKIQDVKFARSVVSEPVPDCFLPIDERDDYIALSLFWVVESTCVKPLGLIPLACS